ncbi:efflux RND transporter periplasmic adaptor subunit [Pseudidiomarina sp. E22-M8]|uniref:efflux RND transporter periplasmic adaptor subunit n=1 Tax=Pseudidiomarina sp. E22-M8 TaxID=3424768 RepID=UPI00403C2A32
MRLTQVLISTFIVLIVSGCGQTEEASHGPVHDDLAALVYTDYTKETELFVEFPVLQVGESSRFLAHLTYLSDFTPIEEGVVDVELRQNDQLKARFRVNSATRAGLFTPVINPRAPGRYQLVLSIKNDRVNSRHDLGTIEVFAASEQAKVDQAEVPGDITYLKEQQWQQPFATQPATEKALRLSVPAFATAKAPADQQATIRAPQSGYFFPEPSVMSGSTVERGQKLGLLVPRAESDQDLITLQLELADYKAQLALSAQEVERLTRLVNNGAIPKSRLQKAQSDKTHLANQVEATQARIGQRQMGKSGGGIALVSPIDGKILMSNGVSGMYLDQREVVYEIAAQSGRWLELSVPERFSDSVNAISGSWLDSQNGMVRLDSDNAQVISRRLSIDEKTRTFSVTLGFDPKVWNPMIGSTYAAHALLEAKQNATAIPISAVIRQEGKDVVFIHSGGETFERREVTLGIRDGSWIEVTDGVQVGERVVTKGAYDVRLAALGGEEIGHGHAH